MGLLGVSAIIALAWVNRFDRVLTDLVVGNFPAIIGLPFAFVAAFIVVSLFRQNEQPLEVEGLGFKLKGAAGEVVLWVLCFMVIVGAIRLLWKY